MNPDATFTLGANSQRGGIQVRLRATRTVAGVESYFLTDCFTVECGRENQSPEFIPSTATLAASPVAIQIEADPSVLDPTGSYFEYPASVQLSVHGQFESGGAAVDLLDPALPFAKCLSFSSSNAVKASVSSDGLITPTGVEFGKFVIAVAFEGQPRAAIEISVIDPNGPVTDVHGHVEFQGLPVVAAEVQVESLGISFAATTDLDGNFEATAIPVVVDDPLRVSARVPGTARNATRIVLPVPGGVTDVGILKLRDALFPGGTSGGGSRITLLVTLDYDGDGLSDVASAGFQVAFDAYNGGGIRYGGDGGLSEHGFLSFPNTSPASAWRILLAADLDGIISAAGFPSEELVAVTKNSIRSYFRQDAGTSEFVETGLPPDSWAVGLFAFSGKPAALGRFDDNATWDLARTYVNGDQRWLEIRLGETANCPGATFSGGEAPGRFSEPDSGMRIPVAGPVAGGFTGPRAATLEWVTMNGVSRLYLGSQDQGTTSSIRVYEFDECGRPILISTQPISDAGSFCVGQFDEVDTPPDVLVFNAGNPVLYLGTPAELEPITNPSFVRLTALFRGGLRGCVAVDLDGDGTDEVVASEIGGLGWLFDFDGAGLVRIERVSHSASGDPAPPAVGDFDGDGLFDVAFGRGRDMLTYPGIGLGFDTGMYFDPLRRAAVKRTGFKPLVVGDVNADGLADLVGNLSIGGSTQGAVYLGQLDGLPFARSSGPVLPLNIKNSSDLDLDGDIDLIGYSNASGLRVFAGSGDGTFCSGLGPCAPVQTLSAGDTIIDAEIRDVDLDGHPDLVYLAFVSGGSNLDLRVAYGDSVPGAPSFENPVSLTTSLDELVVLPNDPNAALELHDMDGDSHPDVLYAEDGVLRVRIFDPVDRTFGPEIVTAVPAIGLSRAIAVLDSPESDEFVVVYHNAGLITRYRWSTSTSTATIVDSQDIDPTTTVRVADVDQDGVLDILTRQLGNLRLYRFDPDLEVWGVTRFGLSRTPGLLAIVDIEGEGDLDVVTYSHDNSGGGFEAEGVFILPNRLQP